MASIYDDDRPYDPIPWPDSSRPLRQGVRAFWAPGEQRWGLDMNQNLDNISSVATLFYDQKGAGGTSGYGYLEDGVGIKDYSGNSFTVEPGTTVYTRNDKRLYVWDGATWYPIGSIPGYSPAALNISVHVVDHRRGSKILSYVPLSSYSLPPQRETMIGGPLGKFVAPGDTGNGAHLSVYKNNTLIGHVGIPPPWGTDPVLASWVPLDDTAPVSFTTSDALNIYHPTYPLFDNFTLLVRGNIGL